jgi:autotransporter-associated beta strand protein
MNTIRKLAAAAILVGSLSTSFAQFPGTWLGAGSDQNWSTGGNWLGGATPGPADRVYFGDAFDSAWTNQIGAVNSTVDVSTAVATLYFTAYAKANTYAHYDTLQINPGVTLTVGGFFGSSLTTFAVGDVPPGGYYVASGFTNYTTITGLGTLSVLDPAGTFTVGGGNAQSPGQGSFLDLTGLSTFNASVRYFYLQVSSDNPFGACPAGQLFLAATNNITTAPSGGAVPGVLLGSIPTASSPGPGKSWLILGPQNNFNSDAFVVGGANGAGFFNYMTFTNTAGNLIGINGDFNFLANKFGNNTGGTFKLRGSSGGLSRASIFSIGDQSAMPGTMSATTDTTPAAGKGFVDFRGGTVDIMVDKLLVGHGPQDGTAIILPVPINSGYLYYDSGTIDANNVYSALEEGTNSCASQSTIFMTGTAVMNVNNNYIMGQVPGRTWQGFPATKMASTNIFLGNAALNIGGNLQHADGSFQATNTASIFILNGPTVNLFNNGTVTLFDFVGYGTISNASSIAISNSIFPGYEFSDTVGIQPGIHNLNLYSNVTFAGQFPLNFTIGTVTNEGAPYNQLINIKGDVNFNSNQVVVAWNGGIPAVGAYPLMKYTGTKTGSLLFTNTSRSSITLDQATPGLIRYVVGPLVQSNLVWNGFVSPGYPPVWAVPGGVTPDFTNIGFASGTMTNWGQPTNGTFFNFDNVTFNDSVTNIGGTNRVYTNICYPVGILYPGNIYITNTGTLSITNKSGATNVITGRNTTFELVGAIRGPCGVTKDGAGMLFWGPGYQTNTFTGDFHINQGSVVALNPGNSPNSTLGLGSIFVTNGATLDLSKVAVGIGNVLYLSGSGDPNYPGATPGVFNGALLFGGTQSGVQFLRTRLTGAATISTFLATQPFGIGGNLNTTFGGLPSINPLFRGELSLNGYNLTVQGTNKTYFVLQDLDANTAGGNITMLAAPLRMTRSTLSGGGTITFTNGGLLEFFNSSAPTNNLIANKIIATNLAILVDTNVPVFGTNLITAELAVDMSVAPPTAGRLPGLTVSNAAQSVEFDGPITGNAQLTKSGIGSCILNGTNTYQGGTFVNGGTLIMGPSGSIPSGLIAVNASANPPTTTLDVTPASGFALASGRTLALNNNVSPDLLANPATVQVNGNITLNSGSVLFGAGTFNGNLTAAANSEIAPGGTNNQGQFVVNGNLALHGVHLTWDVTPSFTTGDGIVVNGNLDISAATGFTNVFTIDSIGGFAPNLTNTLITYTGSLITNDIAHGGGLGSLAFSNGAVRFALSFVEPATTPGKIQVVLSAPPGNLTWAGSVSAPSNTWWDVKTTYNWTNNNASPATNDYFASADFVTFDQNGVVKTVDVGAAGPSLKPVSPGSITVMNSTYTFRGTNGLITSSLLVSNSATLTISNRQNNQIVGAGTVIDGGSKVSLQQATNAAYYSDLIGGGTFEKTAYTNFLKLVGDASQWYGAINVSAGTLTVGQSNAVNNTVNISGTGALDIGGQAIPGAQVTAAGVGPDGNGAVNNRLNVSTNLLNWSSNVVASLTLSGPTTIGALSNAWGIQGLNGGNNNLTKTNANDIWIMTGHDTGLGNITVGQGRLIFGTPGTLLGDTTKSITVWSGATLGFSATNYGVTGAVQYPPRYVASYKSNFFDNNATLLSIGVPKIQFTTNIIPGPILFTNSLRITCEGNNNFLQLLGNISGTTNAAGVATANSLILSEATLGQFNFVYLYGTNSYPSNTWVADCTLYLSNQVNIATNTWLILSNANPINTSIAQLIVNSGGSTFTNRHLHLCASNSAVGMYGSAAWWGNLIMTGSKTVTFGAYSNGGFDLASTNVVATNFAGTAIFQGAGYRVRGSLNLKVTPLNPNLGSSAAVEFGAPLPGSLYYDIPSAGNFVMQLDSTNNWYQMKLNGGRINWNNNNVLPPGGMINVAGSFNTSLMDLHGFNQTLSSIYDTQGLTYQDAFFNDSTTSPSTLTFGGAWYGGAWYGGANKFTNCTTIMLSASTNTVNHQVLNVAVTGGFTELLNTNTYDGVTTVSGGKLLVGNYTAGSNVFSGMLMGTPWLDISNTGIFGGNGFVGCTVTNDNGGTLVPGECLTLNDLNNVFPPSIVTRTGPLTFGNTPLVLNNGSTTFFNVDNTTNGVTGVGTNATIVGLSSVTYGGTLVVSNISNVAFTNNQVVKLFDAVPGNYNGSFATIKVWGALSYDASQLAVNGTIKILVATATAPVTIAKNRPNKNTLSLSWPADHIGWRLQILTNSTATGMVVGGTTNFNGTNYYAVLPNTNWVNCDGTTSFNSTNMTIGNTNVLLRLVYP